MKPRIDIKPYKDDEIEILGRNPLPENNHDRIRRRRRRWIFIALAALAIIIATLVFYLIPRDDYPEVNDDAMAQEGMVLRLTSKVSMPHYVNDSINNLPFTMICLEGFPAKVTFEHPDSLPPMILMALPAADYRADNGGIVGEFIHEGKEIGRGERKKGFCYIDSKGKITLGIGKGEKQMEKALKGEGTFFRQYALVMDGEIQPNILKGKAKRRALGFLDGKPMIVMTTDRESIYDFSEALADYGFSEAIYLPGGDCFLKFITEEGDHYQNPYSSASEYMNYLVFTVD